MHVDASVSERGSLGRGVGGGNFRTAQLRERSGRSKTVNFSMSARKRAPWGKVPEDLSSGRFEFQSLGSTR